MANFNYRSRDKKGELISGEREANRLSNWRPC